MATLPVRNLGDVGVITDVAGYNIPLSGYTTAINVRFDEQISHHQSSETLKTRLDTVEVCLWHCHPVALIQLL